MPAYLIVKVFKVLKVDSKVTYNSDRSVDVAITADNPIQLNWEIMTAANKYEANGKANEHLKIWLEENQEQFSKDRANANHVTESVFVWEIDNDTSMAIANIMISALKEVV